MGIEDLKITQHQYLCLSGTELLTCGCSGYRGNHFLELYKQRLHSQLPQEGALGLDFSLSMQVSWTIITWSSRAKKGLAKPGLEESSIAEFSSRSQGQKADCKKKLLCCYFYIKGNFLSVLNHQGQNEL